MRRYALLAPFAFALVAACSSAPAEEDEVGADEANLDYRSTAGREFDITTEASVTLTGEDARLTGEARMARAKELARLEVDAITQALDRELWAIWPEEKRTNEKNIVAMVRMSTPAGDELRADGDTYRFAYRAQAAGPNNLLDALPLQREGEKRTLKVTVDTRELTLAWTPAAATADAYPRYAELFKDGLDIAVHIGGDHYEPRNDLNEGKALYDDLLSMGLRSPVNSFADLKLDSAPLSGSMELGGRLVPVRAKIIHADMAPDDRLQDLVEAFKKVASTADIVIYRGHAGTNLAYNGVVVHYNPRVAISGAEFKTLSLPNKYQLFVFDGCETYTGYADKLYEHPNKDEKNADVITSVNYGSSLARAESVRTLLHGLLDKTGPRWIPRSWDSILKRVNDVQLGRWTSIYGVHGLADNPKLSMFADPSKIGKTCRTHVECGGGDSLCVSTQGGMVCGAGCTDDTGCPSGSTCQNVTSRTFGAVKQCLPRP